MATDIKYEELDQRCTTVSKTTNKGSLNYGKSLQTPSSSSSPGALGI